MLTFKLTASRSLIPRTCILIGAVILSVFALDGPGFAQDVERTDRVDAPNSGKTDLPLPRQDDIRRLWLVLNQLDEQVCIASAKLDGPGIERKRQIGIRHARLEALDVDLQKRAIELARMRQRREDFLKHSELLDAAETRQLMQRLDGPIAGLEQQLKQLAEQRGQLQLEVTREQKLHTLFLLQAAIESETAPATGPNSQVVKPSPETKAR